MKYVVDLFKILVYVMLLILLLPLRLVISLFRFLFGKFQNQPKLEYDRIEGIESDGDVVKINEDQLSDDERQFPTFFPFGNR